MLLESFFLASVASLALANFNPNSQSSTPIPFEGDAPYSLAESELYSNLFCIGGVESATNPFLLVPGTGNTGAQSWSPAYLQLLGKGAGGLGYDVCYVSPPPAMMGDVQVNAEYIAYALGYLSHISGGAVPVTGWSQGNLATQWALTFWPSIRAKTSSFISFAGDFKGVKSNTPATPSMKRSLSGSSASVMQQASTSQLLKNLAAKGGWCSYSPEDATTGATSYLGTRAPIGNIFIQAICPLMVVSHEDQLYINFSYQVLRLAISLPQKYATPAQVAALRIPCTSNQAAPGLPPSAVVSAHAAVAISVTNFENQAYWVDQEPAAMPYVSTFPDSSCRP